MDPLNRFEFSQSSLQDFVDCPRRFQLRFIQRLAWPALQAEPVREYEAHMRRGERFHRLVQQFLLGVPPERLARMAEADEDENLLRWWQNFFETMAPQLNGMRHIEVTLAAPLDWFRLVAKYDLVLVAADGAITIYDWKTSTRRPKSQTMRDRLQTRIYLYLMVKAGAVLNDGRAVTPEQVQMIYWYAEPGNPPERLAYDRQRMAVDEQFLLNLVRAVRMLGGDEFKMNDDGAACRFCEYRSLCDRGITAGSLEDEVESEPPEHVDKLLDFDLDQISEIEF